MNSGHRQHEDIFMSKFNIKGLCRGIGVNAFDAAVFHRRTAVLLFLALPPLSSAGCWTAPMSMKAISLGCADMVASGQRHQERRSPAGSGKQRRQDIADIMNTREYSMCSRGQGLFRRLSVPVGCKYRGAIVGKRRCVQSYLRDFMCSKVPTSIRRNCGQKFEPNFFTESFTSRRRRLFDIFRVYDGGSPNRPV